MRNPKISIVVPNYNSAHTLRAALQSIVSQQYDNLELIVIDGASTDNSVDVIKEFDSHISYWISEEDAGQSQAINKGLRLCTGEIVNWLCSDDLLTEGALKTVADVFSSNQETDVCVGAGKVEFTDGGYTESIGQGSWVKRVKKALNLELEEYVADAKRGMRCYVKQFGQAGLELMPAFCSISQPSCFYRKELLDRKNPIDETYNYAMDTELWNYFKSKSVNWQFIDDVLSVSIQDGDNKTSTGGEKVTAELERIYRTYATDLVPLTFWQRHFRFPLEKTIIRNPNNLPLVIISAAAWLVVSAILSPFYGFSRVKSMRWSRWA